MSPIRAAGDLRPSRYSSFPGRPDLAAMEGGTMKLKTGSMKVKTSVKAGTDPIGRCGSGNTVSIICPPPPAPPMLQPGLVGLTYHH